MLHRRDVLGAFAAYALLAELSSAGASRRSRSVRAWLNRQEALARGLVAGSLEPEQWRHEVEVLGREADVARLIAEALPSPSSRPFPTHPARRLLHWRDENGKPRSQRYAVALFEFDRTSVITPHAHRGMLSAHLVARGALRARTYDRVSSEPDALVLRPAADRRLETGETSSIGPGARTSTGSSRSPSARRPSTSWSPAWTRAAPTTRSSPSTRSAPPTWATERCARRSSASRSRRAATPHS